MEAYILRLMVCCHFPLEFYEIIEEIHINTV